MATYEVTTTEGTYRVETEDPPAPQESTTQDTVMGGLKGVAKAGLDVVTAPADLLFHAGNSAANAITGDVKDPNGWYPSDFADRAVESLSGGQGDKGVEDTTHLIGNAAEALTSPSIVKSLPKTASKAMRALGIAAEGGLWGLLGAAKEENPLEGGAIGAGVNTLTAGLSVPASKMLDKAMPGRAATKTAQSVAEELRSVLPGALTEAKTPAERAVFAADKLEATGASARRVAGQAFEDLPDEVVNLDSAIQATQDFAEQISGPIVPGSKANTILNALRGYKPADKIVKIPASGVLDAAGNMTREATEIVVPGGPASLPIRKVQDLLRDIGKLGKSADGAEQAILNKAKEAILASVEETSTKEANAALLEARSAWKEMASTFEEGAVGAVRESANSVEGRLTTFKNKLLNDPKGAEQLAKVMSPEEIVNSQHLMLSEMLKASPVSWEKFVANKFDSFQSIFGVDGTEKLLTMVGRDGTVGKKLLEDNNGLKDLLAKLTLKTGISGAIGYEVGGREGAIAGGIAGLALAGKGQVTTRAKSILMRAGMGSEEALGILNSPATEKNYAAAIGRLAAIIPGVVPEARAEEPTPAPIEAFNQPEFEQIVGHLPVSPETQQQLIGAKNATPMEKYAALGKAKIEARGSGVFEPSPIQGIHSFVKTPGEERIGVIPDQIERQAFGQMIDDSVTSTIERARLKSALNKDGSVLSIPSKYQQSNIEAKIASGEPIEKYDLAGYGTHQPLPATNNPVISGFRNGGKDYVGLMNPGDNGYPSKVFLKDKKTGKVDFIDYNEKPSEATTSSGANEFKRVIQDY